MVGLLRVEEAVAMESSPELRLDRLLDELQTRFDHTRRCHL
jgi:hypothetical protein